MEIHMRSIEMTYENVYYYCNVIDNLLHHFTSSIDWVSTGMQFTESFFEGEVKEFSKYSALHNFCDYVVMQLLFEDTEKQLEEAQEKYDESEIQDKEERLKAALGNFENCELEVDRLFKMYGIEHETFFWYLMTHKMESFLDAYNEFTSYDIELDNAMQNLTREIFYILFQNRMFLCRFNSYMASANPVRRKRCYIPKWVKRAVKYRDRGKCVCCGKDLSGLLDCEDKRAVHFDHIVSLQEGGMNDVCNIQLLCDDCNTQKSVHSYTSQTYMDWYDF